MQKKQNISKKYANMLVLHIFAVSLHIFCTLWPKDFSKARDRFWSYWLFNWNEIWKTKLTQISGTNCGYWLWTVVIVVQPQWQEMLQDAAAWWCGVIVQTSNLRHHNLKLDRAECGTRSRAANLQALHSPSVSTRNLNTENLAEWRPSPSFWSSEIDIGS